MKPQRVSRVVQDSGTAGVWHSRGAREGPPFRIRSVAAAVVVVVIVAANGGEHDETGEQKDDPDDGETVVGLVAGCDILDLGRAAGEIGELGFGKMRNGGTQTAGLDAQDSGLPARLGRIENGLHDAHLGRAGGRGVGKPGLKLGSGDEMDGRWCGRRLRCRGLGNGNGKLGQRERQADGQRSTED